MSSFFLHDKAIPANISAIKKYRTFETGFLTDMSFFAKINKIKFLLPVILFMLISASDVLPQKYSVDHAPKKHIRIKIRPKQIFKRDQVKKAEKAQRKKQKKAEYDEIKTKKKFWKKLDRPKELGLKRKVYKRMKKNLKLSERINKNKHRETAVKRMSRKKIKLPKISITKINWPWKKRISSD